MHMMCVMHKGKKNFTLVKGFHVGFEARVCVRTSEMKAALGSLKMVRVGISAKKYL